MAELFIAITVWFGMLNGTMTVDQAVELQLSAGMTYETEQWGDPYCFVFEDGSGECAGIEFPGYDDFIYYPSSRVHYSR